MATLEAHMDRFDRIYRLHRILNGRRTPISRIDLEAKMECSRATVQRAIDEARTFLAAPIAYSRDGNGYTYVADERGPYELPGLWFNADEIRSLLVLSKLLEAAQPGLLTNELTPFKRRINQLLSHRHAANGDLAGRVRILQMAPRPMDPDHFRRVAGALLERSRIRVLYHGRERDRTTERWLSPQRLVHYRSNWYLDAWCHLRRALRTFSLDRLQVLDLGRAAKEVAEEKLDRHLATAYGIFAGKPSHTAVLSFSGAAARWVADEQWHPDQQLRVLEDGGVELSVPYSDPRELIMDILKYGEEVEVVAPASLRREVAERIRRAGEQYREDL